MPTTLTEWFRWQEKLHASNIELGLERLRPVYQALLPNGLTCPVLTIAGTNGKGSCTAMANAILSAAGYRVGVYTSPHLQRYSERICIGAAEVSEPDLLAAFTAVERARQQAGDVAITQFEFGTLAALAYFQSQKVDVAVLEVGLGGRLDAVNIIDANVAIVTAISLDHQSWLGNSVAEIAIEKAGIARKGRPVVCSDPLAPPELVAELTRLGANVLGSVATGGNRVSYSASGATFSYAGPCRQLDELPLPALPGEHQLQHASAVIAALDELVEPVSAAAIAKGLTQLRLRGRLQQLVTEGGQRIVLDVAHNQASAKLLAEQLRAMAGQAPRQAVFAALKDKDLAEIVDPLLPLIDSWHVAEVDDPRGQSAEAIADVLISKGASQLTTHLSVADAMASATQPSTSLSEQPALLVFGSFSVVGPALDWLGG